LEGADKVRNVADGSVLVVEPAVHLLGDVATILIKLAEGVVLYTLNLVFLPLEFVFKFLNQFALHLLPLVALVNNTLLNFAAIFGQVLQDFTLFLHTGVLFSL
jgi:hypothetical protein